MKEGVAEEATLFTASASGLEEPTEHRPAEPGAGDAQRPPPRRPAPPGPGGTTMAMLGLTPMVSAPAADPSVTNTADDTVRGMALCNARAP